MTVQEVVKKHGNIPLYSGPDGSTLFADGFVVCFLFDPNDRDGIKHGKASFTLRAGPFEADPTVRRGSNGSVLA